MSVGRDIEKSRIRPDVNGKDRNGEKWQGSIPGGRGTSTRGQTNKEMS